jgi:hypothetical protein
MGHEDAFLRPKLSARCRFSQGTFAGTWGNGRDAPKATIRASGSETAVGHSAIARLRSDHCRQTDSRCCRARAERGDALPLHRIDQPLDERRLWSPVSELTSASAPAKPRWRPGAEPGAQMHKAYLD